MKIFSWILSGIGAAGILSGLLYPLGLMERNTLLYVLIGGSMIMFIASGLRAWSILRNK